MSPNKKPISALAAAGLALLGLLEGSSRIVARPPEAPGNGRAGGSTEAQAPAKSSVLLLSSGKVLEGEVLEDSNGYSLRHRLGIMRFARRNVEGVFDSLEEVYQYKLDRMPKSDPDERLKLAEWCLGQKLDEAARQQLEAALELSPENRQAKAMLFHLKSGGSPSADPEVRQTSLEMAGHAPPEAPRELPRSALAEIHDASRRPTGPPVILDLPPALATKRYMEFGRYVHVELQNHCARCHNADTYEGDFRLIRARTRRDLQNDLLVRANLDATMRLVNPRDLAHSELLTVSALTHPPDGRPVLSGPNHPSYRVFQTWIANLADRGEPAVAASSATLGGSGASAPEGGAFGAGRSSPGAAKPSSPGFYTPPVSTPANTPSEGAPAHLAPGVPENLNFPTPVSPGNLPQPGQLRPVPSSPVSAPRVNPAPVNPAPRPAPAPQAGAAPPAGPPPRNGQVVTMGDGSRAVYLDGQYIPYLAAEDQTREKVEALAPKPAQPAMPALPASAPSAPAPAQPRKTRPKLDPAALQKFMTGGSG